MKDTLVICFTLDLDSSQLGQVEIAATHEPELVKESGSLVDFEMSHGDLFLLSERPRGDQIVIYDSNMYRLATNQLKFHTDSLFRNEHRDIYYSHKDSIYILNYNTHTNSFETFSLGVDIFNSYLPAKAYNPPFYYYEYPLEMSAGVAYTAYNSTNRQQDILYSYFDGKILRDNIEKQEDIIELKNKIAALSTNTGSNNAMRPYLGSLHNITRMKWGIHSQINVIDDSIYIFNFNTDTFNVYTDSNNLKRQLPMLFDQKKFAVIKKEIITDDDKKECYFKCEIHGITYLQKIDLSSGKPLTLQSIKYTFIEKLRISKGYAYYTCSGTGDNQMFMRHLYKQKIN